MTIPHCTAVFFLATFLIAGCFAQSVLQNPGFETGNLNPWLLDSASNTPQNFGAVSAQNPRSGTYCFRAESLLSQGQVCGGQVSVGSAFAGTIFKVLPGNQLIAAIISPFVPTYTLCSLHSFGQIVPTVQGGEYQISFWASMPCVNYRVGFDVYFDQQKYRGPQDVPSCSNPNNAQAYQQYTFKAGTTSANTIFRIGVVVDTGGNVNVPISFDDFQITRVVSLRTVTTSVLVCRVGSNPCNGNPSTFVMSPSTEVEFMITFTDSSRPLIPGIVPPGIGLQGWAPRFSGLQPDRAPSGGYCQPGYVLFETSSQPSNASVRCIFKFASAGRLEWTIDFPGTPAYSPTSLTGSGPTLS